MYLLCHKYNNNEADQSILRIDRAHAQRRYQDEDDEEVDDEEYDSDLDDFIDDTELDDHLKRTDLEETLRFALIVFVWIKNEMADVLSGGEGFRLGLLL